LLFESLKSNGLAIMYGKLSVNMYQGLRADISALDKPSQTSYEGTVEFAYRDLAKMLAQAGRYGEAESVLGLLKDEEYFKFVNTRGPAAGRKVDLSKLEKAWLERYDDTFKALAGLSVEYSRLSAIRPAARTKAEQARRLAIDARFAACNRALRGYLSAARRAFEMAGTSADRVNDLRDAPLHTGTLKLLPDRPVAVYAFVTADGIHLLVNLPNTCRLVAPQHNVPADALQRKIGALRFALQHPDVDPRPLASELYELLVRPIGRDLADGRVGTILWSLDWSLRYVPLWALYDAKKQRYLIEEFPCSLFTPSTFDRLSAAAHSPTWHAVEFGVSQARAIGDDRFPPLTGVPIELGRVASLLGGEPKIDSAFTLAALQSALPGPSVVHIATHFKFIQGDEEASFMVLGEGKLPIQDFRDFPNGCFDGVELLVLSACNTAAGDIDADGSEFESFALLAQDKGAAAVIASLWDVNDESTALLMGEFYRLRKANPDWTKLQALRHTQLEMLNGKITGAGATRRSAPAPDSSFPTGLRPFPYKATKPFAHPFYWAPFVLYGNYK
jgi:CHAT domain-containing protein